MYAYNSIILAMSIILLSYVSVSTLQALTGVSYLKVFAVDVLQAVPLEEAQDDREHPLGVRGEVTVAIGAETFDEMSNDVVQTYSAQEKNEGKIKINK